MKLKTFIDETGEEKCARLFGVAVRTINSWKWGERVPRHKKAMEIVKATGGKVSYSECYGQDAAQSSEKAA